MTPCLSCYVPYFRTVDGRLARPTGRARLEESAAPYPDLELVFVEDVVRGGSGVGGMFAQIPAQAHRVTGRYVLVLADDDVLLPDVAHVAARLDATGEPDVLIVSTEKGHHGRLPYDTSGPPRYGRIDLGCVITRRDVWLQHVADYGQSYEGDYHHVSAMWDAGRTFVYATDLLVSRGAVSAGRAE